MHKRVKNVKLSSAIMHKTNDSNFVNLGANNGRFHTSPSSKYAKIDS